MDKILIILGHPNLESYNNELAESYAAGAREKGAEVKMLKLAELDFDPILHGGFSRKQPLEDDLKEAQSLIMWANHLVWVYPSWWGSIPALLKGFIDRTFLPGFAFKYRENSIFWDKYLTGKSARLILTMDTPRFYNWLIYRSANIRQMKNATLQFSGVKTVKITVFDSIRTKSKEQLTQNIEKVYKIAFNESAKAVKKEELVV